jgi:hypothetical protein
VRPEKVNTKPGIISMSKYLFTFPMSSFPPKNLI